VTSNTAGARGAAEAVAGAKAQNPAAATTVIAIDRMLIFCSFSCHGAKMRERALTFKQQARQQHG
jgi:hypothetical protein